MADNSGAEAYGRIVNLLVAQKKLSSKQLQHAQRVHTKLSTPQPLLKVCVDLKYINESDIKEAVRSTHNIRIGDLLTELGYITPDDLSAAIRIQKAEGGEKKLGDILITHNFIEEQLLIEVLSIQMGFPLVEPNLNVVDMDACARIPKKILISHNLLPVHSEDENAKVALADPLDQTAKVAARKYLGQKVTFALAQRDALQKTIELLVDKKNKTRISVDNKTVVGIANTIILGAINNNASDIHIEPLPDRLQVRFREDGVLQHFNTYPHDIIPALTSRFKIMCDANIAEKRRHQGGRILFEYDEGELDLRASFFVTVHGEKIVLRLLNKKQELLDIQSIGLQPRMLSRFLDEAVFQPSGVLLVTGPTGSGKTSSIYSCIHTLKGPNVSIVTAEEPVEYVIEGISQCSIDPKIDLTFEETLRHIVRQDPDIIVIGEIRDTYSAEVAVQAALTGHKVLSTFHTEDSIGGLIRLLNMDIAPFMVSSTVVSVLAQRLLRKVCPYCAVETKPAPIQVQRMKTTLDSFHGAQFKKGRGCRECKQTGYKGRIGVFELLVLDELVRDAILEQKTSYEIRNISINNSGLVTLLEDGLVKAASGMTTIDEVLRCLPIFQPPRPLMELKRLVGV
ncbi:MAG: secretion system protein E [Desulfobulbus propionicus]|nr:MAG: secretion system protein E [Desulfobulbus propionicus]